MTRLAALLLVLFAACAPEASRRPAVLAPPVAPPRAAPARCRVEALPDLPVPPVRELAAALTPAQAVVAYAPAWRELNGTPDGHAYVFDRATGTVRDALSVARAVNVVTAARGADVWTVWYENGTPTRVVHVLGGAGAAADDFTLPLIAHYDAAVITDDGALWIALSNPASEEGTPYGAIARIAPGGDLRVEDRGSAPMDAPYLGLLPRPGGRVAYVRRAFGRLRYAETRPTSLRTLDAALAEVSNVPLTAPVETCVGSSEAYACPRCGEPLALGVDVAVACEDGSVHRIAGSGADARTALHRRVVASGLVGGRLLVVTGGEDYVAAETMELTIEAPPGTAIGTFRHFHTLDRPVAGPVVASSGDDALVAWADGDASGWKAHARIVRCP